jgi:hypothetical protein
MIKINIPDHRIYYAVCSLVTDISFWNFVLTSVTKHDHLIHDMDHKFALVEICDRY